jgi:hypothetical protein
VLAREHLLSFPDDQIVFVALLDETKHPQALATRRTLRIRNCQLRQLTKGRYLLTPRDKSHGSVCSCAPRWQRERWR